MRLTQFGTYSIPQYTKQDNLSTGVSGGVLVALPGGGAYDAYGTETAPENATTLTSAFELVATTTALMQTYRDAVRALRGKVARLWATFPDGSVRFVWARCTQVSMERKFGNNYVQPVELTFEVKEPTWNGAQHGAPWYLDAGKLLDDGLYLDLDDTVTLNNNPKTITTATTNAGNRDVTTAQITVSAVSAPIGWVQLTCGDCVWRYTGTIASGQSLTVDCGTRSVLNNGSNAYSGFVLQAAHADEAWLRLEPGANTVTVETDGIDAATHTISFAFYDGYN